VFGLQADIMTLMAQMWKNGAGKLREKQLTTRYRFGLLKDLVYFMCVFIIDAKCIMSVVYVLLSKTYNVPYLG